MPLPQKMKNSLGKIVDIVINNHSNPAEALKALTSQDSLEIIEKSGSIKLGKDSPWDIVQHFFGMNKYWPTWRNVLGVIMVHCPEYPTYFIPAFTQAKQTGDAKELKKGEGPRGLITGGLEGIAVGALVSGEKLSAKTMIPYIFLGAGLQLISSLVFPWLGEKIGKYLYNKNINEKANEITPSSDISVNKDQTLTQAPNSNTVQFKARLPYNKIYNGNLKI